MKMYLASRFDHKELMKVYREYIEKQTDITVCSRWIDSHDHITQVQASTEDYEDIYICDTLMFFSEHPTIGYNSGGRHVEYGMALAFHKQIWVIGQKENVFHYYPEQIKHFESFVKWYNWYNPHYWYKRLYK